MSQLPGPTRAIMLSPASTLSLSRTVAPLRARLWGLLYALNAAHRQKYLAFVSRPRHLRPAVRYSNGLRRAHIAAAHVNSETLSTVASGFRNSTPIARPLPIVVPKSAKFFDAVFDVVQLHVSPVCARLVGHMSDYYWLPVGFMPSDCAAFAALLRRRLTRCRINPANNRTHKEAPSSEQRTNYRSVNKETYRLNKEDHYGRIKNSNRCGKHLTIPSEKSAKCMAIAPFQLQNF